MVVHIVVVGSVNVRGTLWLTVVSNLNVLERRCQWYVLQILAVIHSRGDLNNIAHMRALE
jgi:hypothetical protein